MSGINPTPTFSYFKYSEVWGSAPFSAGKVASAALSVIANLGKVLANAVLWIGNLLAAPFEKEAGQGQSCLEEMDSRPPPFNPAYNGRIEDEDSYSAPLAPPVYHLQPVYDPSPSAPPWNPEWGPFPGE